MKQALLRGCCSNSTFRAIQWLDSLRNFEKSSVPAGAGTAGSSTWDLGTMHSLLRHMKDPQHHIQRVIHVVGTKGKGSSAVMLEAMLQEAGYKVGRYSSPHLTCPGERISVGGQQLSWNGFNDLICNNVSAMSDAVKETPSISYFEAFTALAIQHFAESKVDWAIVEAGLGGVMDATNVFTPDQVKATLITALEREHLAALGGSIESIALAKAGIVHPGGLAVISPQPLPEAQSALQAVLQQMVNVKTSWVKPQALRNAGMCLDGDEVRQKAAPSRELWDILGEGEVSLRMVGTHQVQNAAAAVGVMHELQNGQHVAISPEQVRAGLENAQLPGRFSLTAQERQGTGRWWLCMDSAHTGLSCASLVATLQAVFPRRPPVALIVAMAADKDCRAIMMALSDLAPQLVVCVAAKEGWLSNRGLPAENVASVFKSVQQERSGGENGHAAHVCTAESMGCAEQVVTQWLGRVKGIRHQPSGSETLDAAVGASAAGEKLEHALPVVCVTGSNYIVGSAIEVLLKTS